MDMMIMMCIKSIKAQTQYQRHHKTIVEKLSLSPAKPGENIELKLFWSQMTFTEVMMAQKAAVYWVGG